MKPGTPVVTTVLNRTLVVTPIADFPDVVFRQGRNLEILSRLL
jgi:hypothetical protein